MALRLFGETAALRDFDPAYARLGSKADIRARRAMSAIPPKADIAECDWHIGFVPKADIALPEGDLAHARRRLLGAPKPARNPIPQEKGNTPIGEHTIKCVGRRVRTTIDGQEYLNHK